MISMKNNAQKQEKYMPGRDSNSGHPDESQTSLPLDHTELTSDFILIYGILNYNNCYY